MLEYLNIKSPRLSRRVIVRALLFAACVAAIYFFMPRSHAGQYEYTVGKTWSYDDLVAPFDIEIRYPEAEQRRLMDSVSHCIDTTYLRDNTVLADLKKQLTYINDTLPDDAGRKQIYNALEAVYKRGIVELVSRPSYPDGKISLRVNTNELLQERADRFLDLQQAYKELIEVVTNHEARAAMHKDRLNELMRPNIVFDTAFYSERLAAQVAFIQAPKGKKQQGETIVARGQAITPQIAQLIDTYVAKTRADSTVNNTYVNMGKLLVIIILMAMLFTYLRFYRPQYYGSWRKLLFVCIMVTAFTIFAFMMYSAFDYGLYIVPLTAIPIVVVVFLDARTAFFSYMVTLLLCAVLGHYMWDFVLMQFVAGFVALVSINDLSKRSQLLRAALLVFVAYSVVYTTSLLLDSGSLNKVDPHMYWSFAINAILISFAYFIIFVNEKAFGFISRVTLVELSDINHPVLRELSEECPGTFQHSMAVSNLAAAAAAKVGANTQLIRTGALYHDIGKMANPAFFTENQHGVNPHDALSPLQSAKIVIGHVTEGLRRAERAKLPEQIRRFIREHHGRGTARYFYTSYCNSRPGESVDPAPFTYPGPNPQTLESSILMMADAVEAASRSLKEHTPEAINALVDKIIDTQVSEGLHKESPISFRDIALIKQSFAQSLRTMYHSRISYPDAIK